MKFSIEFDQVAGWEITLDEFWNPVIPLISSLPGVYCLEATRGGEITTSYVGEAGNLNARLGQYRKSGPPNKTYTKINAWMTESLQGGERRRRGTTMFEEAGIYRRKGYRPTVRGQDQGGFSTPANWDGAWSI